MTQTRVRGGRAGAISVAAAIITDSIIRIVQKWMHVANRTSATAPKLQGSDWHVSRCFLQVDPIDCAAQTTTHEQRFHGAQRTSQLSIAMLAKHNNVRTRKQSLVMVAVGQSVVDQHAVPLDGRRRRRRRRRRTNTTRQKTGRRGRLQFRTDKIKKVIPSKT